MLSTHPIRKDWDWQPVIHPFSIWLEPDVKILTLTPSSQQGVFAVLHADQPGKLGPRHLREHRFYAISEGEELPEEDSHGWMFVGVVEDEDRFIYFYKRII